MVASLRQDNTELRHRLRLQGGGKRTEEESLAGLNRTVADLQSTNTKLKKEIELLKKELSRSDVAYQKLRTESAKEVNRWKAKAMEPRRGSTASQAIERSSPNVSDRSLVDNLRKKVAELERELRLERLASSRSSSGYNRSPRDGLAPNCRAATPPLTRPRSNRTTPNSGYRGPGTFGSAGRGRSGASHNRSISPNIQSSGYGRPTSGSRANAYRGSVTSSVTRSRSISPGFGSSVGGRFDPTAYQRQKEEKRQQVLANRVGMAYSPRSYDSQESPVPRTRRVRSTSRPTSSPSLRNSGSSATKKAIKKSASSSVSTRGKPASVTAGILSSGG